MTANNDPRRKGHKGGTDAEEKSNSSLSLNDLETVSNIPSKDISSNSKKSNANETFESSFVRVTKLSSNNYSSKSNGDVSNTNTSRQRTKHNNSKQKAPVESDYELDISDSEESTSSSRLSHDNSPKTNRNATIDNLQNKLKEEQIYRWAC